MAETVGALIFSAIEAAGVSGAAAAGSTALVGSLTVNAVVGSAALLGASIGLSYALSSKPNVPAPEAGAQPLKQSVPPRIRGYWICRLAGYYMLFAAAGVDSQDMIAFHSGRISSVIQVYLHDQVVPLSVPPTDGTVCVVQALPNGQFKGNCVDLQIFYGSDTQNSSSLINASNTAGVWTTAFAGKGIACMALYCHGATDPSDYTIKYQQGLPLPSVLAYCSPIWDPRDPAQSRADSSTWRPSGNPVLQLIDYLTNPDGGMGMDVDQILPPDVLSRWMTEANLCEGRYISAGWYEFDNTPDAVIGKILSTCDGWLAEAGDGTLSLTVGVYRPPTDAPITEQHILGFSAQYGLADEDSVNELDVTYTSPADQFVSVQIDPVRDEDAISRTGIVRSQQLDLSWVIDEYQANILASRALLRLNPKMTGTLTTTLYGLNYVGERWVPIQFPLVKGMENCVVEIQDKAEIDLLGGKVTFTWNLVDVDALTELGSAQPAYVREDSSYLKREDGSTYVRENPLL